MREAGIAHHLEAQSTDAGLASSRLNGISVRLRVLSAGKKRLVFQQSQLSPSCRCEVAGAKHRPLALRSLHLGLPIGLCSFQFGCGTIEHALELGDFCLQLFAFNLLLRCGQPELGFDHPSLSLAQIQKVVIRVVEEG